jgi:hypothetical protein
MESEGRSRSEVAAITEAISQSVSLQRRAWQMMTLGPVVGEAAWRRNEDLIKGSYQPVLVAGPVAVAEVTAGKKTLGEPGRARAARRGANQSVEPIDPGVHTLLPTDRVGSPRFRAFAHRAWEMGQTDARKLDAIEDLLNAGDEAGALAAMRDYFHIKKAN